MNVWKIDGGFDVLGEVKEFLGVSSNIFFLVMMELFVFGGC